MKNALMTHSKLLINVCVTENKHKPLWLCDWHQSPKIDSADFKKKSVILIVSTIYNIINYIQYYLLSPKRY